MAVVWGKFLGALESKGLTFDAIKFAENRVSVIDAVGFSDPLDIAVIQTNWENNTVPTAAARSNEIRKHFVAGALSSKPKSNAAVDVVEPITPEYVDSLPAQAFSSLLPEQQDAVIVHEALHALCGCHGQYIVQATDGTFLVSAVVPRTLRGPLSAVLKVANAHVELSKLAHTAECGAKGLVLMALGESIKDILNAYVVEVGHLAEQVTDRRTPLVAVVAETERIGLSLLCLQSIAKRIAGAHGGALLHILHELLTFARGEHQSLRIINRVLSNSCVPYFQMLSRWIYDGTLDDPYNEFFVVQNMQFAERSMAVQWEKRFSKRSSNIPGFIDPGRTARMIFWAGKFAFLLREYSPSTWQSRNETITWVDEDALRSTVEQAYQEVTDRVVKMLFDKEHDLLGHLNSMKNYFLIGQGDWLVDFLDSSEILLRKSPNEVKTKSIKVLLQSSIAKTCQSDPYHSAISCNFSSFTLEDFVTKMQVAEGSSVVDEPSVRSSRVSTGQTSVRVKSRSCIQHLQLECQYEWPLTMVIDNSAISHLNCMFRLLLWCRTCERALQSRFFSRNVRLPGQAVLLRQEMIHFLRQFQFYAAHFVIEPEWIAMRERVAKAPSIQVINTALDGFFQNVFRGLILSSPQRFASLSEILGVMTKFTELCIEPVGVAKEEQRDRLFGHLNRQYHQALQQMANPAYPDYPQLVTLLTWIDFNRFYAKTGVYQVIATDAAQGEVAQLHDDPLAMDSPVKVRAEEEENT